jgi:hypothetical protein
MTEFPQDRQNQTLSVKKQKIKNKLKKGSEILAELWVGGLALVSDIPQDKKNNQKILTKTYLQKKKAWRYRQS